jgi:hypothetical protein
MITATTITTSTSAANTSRPRRATDLDGLAVGAGGHGGPAAGPDGG